MGWKAQPYAPRGEDAIRKLRYQGRGKAVAKSERSIRLGGFGPFLVVPLQESGRHHRLEPISYSEPEMIPFLNEQQNQRRHMLAETGFPWRLDDEPLAIAGWPNEIGEVTMISVIGVSVQRTFWSPPAVDSLRRYEVRWCRHNCR